ncbi:MAG: hypothetical protein Q9187_002040 [Circinaria calcarea]
MCELLLIVDVLAFPEPGRRATWDGGAESIPDSADSSAIDSSSLTGGTSTLEELATAVVDKLEAAGPLPTGLREFRLTNAVGQEVESADLLAQGPLLVTFYRGEWCPYCNLALAAMQKHVDEFTAKGVTLVAISPELPDQALTTTQKHDLKFPVLSNVGNRFAKQLGIVFPQPEAMRPVFEIFGHDLKACNGDDSLEVPVPATFLMDQKGVVRNAYIEADYSQRLEPSTAME